MPVALEPVISTPTANPVITSPAPTIEPAAAIATPMVLPGALSITMPMGIPVVSMWGSLKNCVPPT